MYVKKLKCVYFYQKLPHPENTTSPQCPKLEREKRMGYKIINVIRDSTNN
jgi:hypothetical protein